MRGLLLYASSGRGEAWTEAAIEIYSKKIAGFLPFQIQAVRSRSVERGADREKKILAESKSFLEQIDKNDFVIAFDEKGKLCKDSRAFSEQLVRAFESGKPKVVFLIGGPYGLSDEIRTRANALLSLSPLTMSHPVALVTASEQIYRALTIWRNIPYHNG